MSRKHNSLLCSLECLPAAGICTVRELGTREGADSLSRLKHVDAETNESNVSYKGTGGETEVINYLLERGQCVVDIHGASRCGLTTPHKLQGRGSVGKPIPGGMGVSGPRKPMAAP
jgi:hypothetical protein